MELERDRTNDSDDATENARTTTPDRNELSYEAPRVGRPWTKEQVKTGLQAVLEAIRMEDEASGEAAWWVGDKLRALYRGFAEQASGAASFTALVRDQFGLEASQLSEYLRIRRRVDRGNARKYGRTALRLGLRLMDALGLQTFDALVKQELTLSDGTTTTFPATRQKLEDALRVLRQERAFVAPASVKARTADRNERLEGLVVREPALEGVKLRFEPGEEEPELRIRGALSSEAVKALARVLTKLR